MAAAAESAPEHLGDVAALVRKLLQPGSLRSKHTISTHNTAVAPGSCGG